MLRRPHRAHQRDAQDLTECVVVDLTFRQVNCIRIVGRKRCEGFVYVSARIEGNRSPVVAVIKVQ